VLSRRLNRNETIEAIDDIGRKEFAVKTNQLDGANFPSSIFVEPPATRSDAPDRVVAFLILL
jgi:hypothetical protein